MDPRNRKHIHDHFFRESMARIAIANGVLLLFINPLILKTINFSTFEIVKDDWISEKFKESRSDILYRAKLLNQNEWIYFLFEHKSSPDKNTPYQILRYMNQIWDEYKKQNSTSRKMPVILSVIVYHGKKPWNISNSTKPLFAIIKETGKYVPDFKSEIIDLSILNDQELGDKIELRAFLMACKYSRSPEIFKVLPGIIRSFNRFGKSDDDYLREVLLYLGSLSVKSKVGEFLEIIEQEHMDGVSYMETIADALAEEGRRQERKKTQQIKAELRKEIQQNKAAFQEEIRQNKAAFQAETRQKEIALREEMHKEVALLRKEAKEAKENERVFIVKQLLQKKMSIGFIHETTGLTKKRIEEIKKKMG